MVEGAMTSTAAGRGFPDMVLLFFRWGGGSFQANKRKSGCVNRILCKTAERSFSPQNLVSRCWKKTSTCSLIRE